MIYFGHTIGTTVYEALGTRIYIPLVSTCIHNPDNLNVPYIPSHVSTTDATHLYIICKNLKLYTKSSHGHDNENNEKGKRKKRGRHQNETKQVRRLHTL